MHARHRHVKECDNRVTKCGVHAGEEEAPRAAARAVSRKEAEPKQTGRAARESKGSAQASGAAEAPDAPKEAAVRASQPGLAARASAPANSEASSRHLLGLGMWCMGEQLMASLTGCSSGSSSTMCRSMCRTPSPSQGICQNLLPLWLRVPLVDDVELCRLLS